MSYPGQVTQTGLRHIVVAEDDASTRQYLQQLLGSRYQVEAAADGEAALQLIGKQIPDLIVSDIGMPKRDGLELLKVLREDPRTAAIPVILLSVRSDEETRVRGIEAGADDYLTKPFSPRELLARVAAHLEGVQGPRHREQMLRREARTARRRERS